VTDPGESLAAPGNTGPADVGDNDEPKAGQGRPRWTATLVQVALLLVGVYFFIRAFQGVDLAQLTAALRSASIPLLLLALGVAQLPRFTWAVSTRAACPQPIPYKPVVLLQFALPFFNLIAPYTAARMAVNIRFFRRLGVAPAAAVSLGAIDTSAGAVVEVVLLVLLLVFGVGNVNLDFKKPDDVDGGDLLHFLVVIGLLAIGVGVVWLVIPKLRRRLLAVVRPWVRDAMEPVSGLRSPSRIGLLLLGNLGSDLLLATTLWIVLRAYHTSASFATVLAVNVGVSLFAGLIPVPGGIGISEGALTVGLLAAGIDQATALVCAVSYRLCTYYLPPIWAWFAYRRLARDGLL
jgi:glycosyltransferase 2 family protein